MKHDYTKLDAAIVAAVKNGVTVFSRLENHPQVTAAVPPGAEVFRSIDRRLQALRMAGKLIHTRKGGWRAV